MKYKNYGNTSQEDYASGLNTEFIEAEETISARNTNRSIVNLYENQESDYNVLQTLLKTIYGNSNGIIPDVLEEFIPESMAIGSFKNNTSVYYLRVPTGMMLLSLPYNETALKSNKDNPFLKKGDYNYNDNVKESNFLQDELKSYIIENKPQINLFERQLGNLINLDLSDLANDIKITHTKIPFAVKVLFTDDEGNPKYDSYGNPYYLTHNSNTIYLAESGKGNLNIYADSSKTPITINDEIYKTIYKNVTNHNTETLNNEVIKQTVVYTDGVTMVEEIGGNYTTDISKAKILVDANGNKKYKDGYCLKVVRSANGDNEITYLPNQAKSRSFTIYPKVGGMSSTAKNDIDITFSGEAIETVSTSAKVGSQKELANLINNAINSQSNYFNSSVVSILVDNSTVYGLNIYLKDEYDYSSVNIAVKYNPEGSSDKKLVYDEVTSQAISGVEIGEASEQKYFENIFELVNTFIEYFSENLTSSNFYKYINLETILELKGSDFVSGDEQTFYLCYDLNSDGINKYSSNYDKEGRFTLLRTEPTDDNIIVLYKLTIKKNSGATETKVIYTISEIESYYDPLDRRMIASKRAELNSLLSTTRTELENYISMSDDDSNRKIEITEKAEEADNEQLRITSPITRVETAQALTEVDKDTTSTWADSGNGDTPSDFFEKPFEVYDTTTDTSKYYKHNDSDIGVIVDKNTGINIFNKNTKKTAGNYSYSQYKPIEFYSESGNINFFRKNSGRINIANFSDGASDMVDILGKTRIRSKQDDVLTLRKIADSANDNSLITNFVLGTSNSKNDANTIGDNFILGKFIFYSGTYDSVANSRTFSLQLPYANATGLNDVLKFAAYSDYFNASIKANAKIAGTLETTNKLTVSNSTNKSGADIYGKVTVKSGGADINGDTSVTGTLKTTKKLTVSDGGADITGDTSITGNTKITGTFTTTDKLTVKSGGADIYGNSSITGTLQTTDKFTVNNGGADIYGNTNIYGKTGITGDTDIYGNTKITGKLETTDKLTVSNSTNKSGAEIYGDSSVVGTLRTTDKLFVSNPFDKRGAEIYGNTSVAGNFITTGSFDAGNTTIDSKLSVGTTSTNNGNVVIYGSNKKTESSPALKVNGFSNLTGNTKITGTLQTTSKLTVNNGGADITGNSSVAGTLSINGVTLSTSTNSSDVRDGEYLTFASSSTINGSTNGGTDGYFYSFKNNEQHVAQFGFGAARSPTFVLRAYDLSKSKTTDAQRSQTPAIKIWSSYDSSVSDTPNLYINKGNNNLLFISDGSSATLNQSLAIIGTLRATDKLTVNNGGADIYGDAKITGRLETTDKLTVKSGGADITDDTTIDSKLSVGTTSTNNGNVVIYGSNKKTESSPALKVNGFSNLTGDVKITGRLETIGDLVVGNYTNKSGAVIFGDATIAGTLLATDKLTVTFGGADIYGNTYIDGGLRVSANTSITPVAGQIICDTLKLNGYEITIS